MGARNKIIKTIEQIKALLRATDPSCRFDLLTEVFLETESDEIERFTENYRMVLGASHRKELKENLARISGLIEKAIIPSKENGYELDGEKL